MSAQDPTQVELHLPRRRRLVRVARKTAWHLAHCSDFTIDDVFDIELAVGEACTNAMEYACGEGRQEVVLRFAVDAERLVVEVRNRGRAFDPDRDTELSQEGGLGLQVIRAVMDEVEVREEAGCCCVRMVKLRKVR